MVNKCQTCGADFTNKRNLNRHVLTHQPKKMYFCPLCHLAITRKDNLVPHMVRLHKLDRLTANEKCKTVKPVNEDSILSTVVQPEMTTTQEPIELNTIVRMRRQPNERANRITSVEIAEDRSRKRARVIEVCLYKCQILLLKKKGYYDFKSYIL